MQKLKIEGFLGIKNAEIALNGISLIIGPQASGKSVIARLIYFFNEYFADFDELPLMRNEHKRTYDKRKREDFFKIFPQYAWHDDSFVITFETNEHSVTLTSQKGSSSLDLSTSSSVADSFRSLKRAFSEYSESHAPDKRMSQIRMLREFRMEFQNGNSARYEHALFVPAARSFYATIREEIFAILSMDEKIDRIIMQFGDFYENAKIHTALRNEPRRGSRNETDSHFNKYFDAIAKGRYARIDGRDWIEMDRGRIEMSKASSGQQEAFPLLVALSHFPDKGRTLIIEEPEAHLFPSAQVKMLEFIVSQAISKETNMLLTTHSPYLLSAMNNFILQSKVLPGAGIPPERVTAFSLQDGSATSIFDEEYNLISADYIDQVSDDINNEFSRLLEKL